MEVGCSPITEAAGEGTASKKVMHQTQLAVSQTYFLLRSPGVLAGISGSGRPKSGCRVLRAFHRQHSHTCQLIVVILMS